MSAPFNIISNFYYALIIIEFVECIFCLDMSSMCYEKKVKKNTGTHILGSN